MNPITNTLNQNKINVRELESGISGGSSKSWHQKYSESAWIFVGGLPYDLNEGDILAVFSQYGEIVNLNLVRDRETGKSRGFGFVCYEDQRSTILAVDNLNGINLLKRIIRVDHVEEYKVPKYKEQVDEATLSLWTKGCAPKPIQVPEDAEDEDVDRTISMKRAGKLTDDGFIPLTKDEEKQMKKDAKRQKKEARKEKKRLKEERKRLAAEGFEDTVENVDEVSWKLKRKLIDKGPADVDDIYNKNEHFNFGKPKKELPPPPTHNLRPDFEKADWREIEIYKAVKERERLEKGEKQSNWKEEEHYLPKRFQRI